MNEETNVLDVWLWKTGVWLRLERIMSREVDRLYLNGLKIRMNISYLVQFFTETVLGSTKYMTKA